MRHQQSNLLRNTVRWLPLSGAVAWALTRDKQFTVRARRAPGKCFVGDDLVYAGDKYKRQKPALEHYFDNADAAWEQVCKEITNGKIKTTPPDWCARKEENWLTNNSVRIDYAELQSVFRKTALSFPRASYKRCFRYVADRNSLLDRHRGRRIRVRLSVTSEKCGGLLLRSCSKGLPMMRLICSVEGMARGCMKKSQERRLLISAFTFPSKFGPSVFFQMSPTWSALASAQAIICSREGSCNTTISELRALKSLDFGPFGSNQRVCLRSATTGRDCIYRKLH
jgi:hypothetical protein